MVAFDFHRIKVHARNPRNVSPKTAVTAQSQLDPLVVRCRLAFGLLILRASLSRPMSEDMVTFVVVVLRIGKGDCCFFVTRSLL